MRFLSSTARTIFSPPISNSWRFWGTIGWQHRRKRKSRDLKARQADMALDTPECATNSSVVGRLGFVRHGTASQRGRILFHLFCHRFIFLPPVGNGKNTITIQEAECDKRFHTLNAICVACLRPRHSLASPQEWSSCTFHSQPVAAQ